MNDGAALGLVLDQVSKDKNIDRAVLVETLEQAILTAAKRAFGMHREMEAKFNEESGRVDLFQIIIIAETITPGNEGKEVLLADAQRFGLKADPGDELLFQIFYDEKDQARAEEQDAKYGELLKLNRAWKGFGRIAAQTAKQAMMQRIRQVEKEMIYEEFKDRAGEIVSGTVRRFAPELWDRLVERNGPRGAIEYTCFANYLMMTIRNIQAIVGPSMASYAPSRSSF